MKVIGNIITYFGLYIVYMGTIYQQQNNYSMNRGKAIIYSIIGLLIARFGSKIVEFGEKLKQETADDKAKNILENPEKSGDYAVYLRPFNIDQTFEKNNSLGSHIFSWDEWARPGKDHLEKVLYDSLKNTYPLIALGKSNEDTQGIGRAGLYENWKERVSAAISGSQLILVVPSANDGTLWEIQEIFKNYYLEKTVLIMPPNNPYILYKGDVEYINKWQNASDAIYSIVGVRLPAYDKNGAFFSYDSQGNLSGFVEIGNLTPNNIAKKLNNHFRRKSANSS